MKNWIQTRSGTKFSLSDPQPEDVHLSDIAFSLSNQCRYNGHVDFYSVAQHSVHVSWMCKDFPFEALMHDAAEAYMGDVPSPLKRLLGEKWYEIESKVEKVVWSVFGIEAMPFDVKHWDSVALATEKRDFLIPLEWNEWTLPAPHPIKLEAFDAVSSKALFLTRFYELMEGR